MGSSRIVIVTGGAGDIGMAIAGRYAARGDRVVLCDIKAETLRARVVAHAARARLEAHATDLRDPRQLRCFVGEVLDRHGRVDVLVNNAAFQHDGDAVATTDADFEDSFGINLRAPFLLSRAVAPSMRQNGGGAIINVASVHALAPGPARFAYATMKAGLIGMTRSMAVDLGRHNIRVNAVVPSATRTSALERAWTEERDPERRGSPGLYEWAARQHPMRRIGEVEDIAELVEFLGDCRFINGVDIRVDGGLLAALRLLPPEPGA
jgi:NAD(P)-dependent dehydrogenase (short-subunit alcohol dehydrogenase family)